MEKTHRSKLVLLVTAARPATGTTAPAAPRH